MATTLFNRTAAREAGYEMSQYICTRMTRVANAADVGTVKIGTIPAGAVITSIISKVSTAVSGGTPVMGISSVAAGGAIPAVGGTSNVQAVMAEAAGTEQVFPSNTLVQPLTVDTDFYLGTSGGATDGDVVVAIFFVKPLA